MKVKAVFSHGCNIFLLLCFFLKKIVLIDCVNGTKQFEIVTTVNMDMLWISIRILLEEHTNPITTI